MNTSFKFNFINLKKSIFKEHSFQNKTFLLSFNLPFFCAWTERKKFILEKKKKEKHLSSNKSNPQLVCGTFSILVINFCCLFQFLYHFFSPLAFFFHLLKLWDSDSLFSDFCYHYYTDLFFLIEHGKRKKCYFKLNQELEEIQYFFIHRLLLE